MCLLGTADNESPLHALKGDYRLTELLSKEHVPPEIGAISLLNTANNGKIRGVYLVLNLTMSSVESKDNYVGNCWECWC